MRKTISFLIGFIKSIDVRKLNKKTVLIVLIILAIITGGFFIGRKYLKPRPKQIYEALIAVRSQFNPDPKEDAKNSLKAGDVILVLPEGHRWSDTEKVSYLILKINLTEKQARTLVSPEERKAVEPKPKPAPSGAEGTEEEKKRAAERKKAEGDRERMETVRARRYRIKLEELDKNFDPNILLEKQPYLDNLYDWKIVEKKPRV